jgi:hypothetical protein
MKDQDFLESALRELRPAPMPDALIARLAAAEPAAGPAPDAGPRHIWHPAAWGGFALAAAACLALAAHFLARPPAAPAPSLATQAATVPARRLHHEATLIDQRTLAVIHQGGRAWELAEQQWLHRADLVRAAPPSEVSTAALSREVVWQPVNFD